MASSPEAGTAAPFQYFERRGAEDVVGRLVAALESIGFPDITDCFLPWAGWTFALAQRRIAIDAPLRRTIDLLLLSRSVPAGELPFELQQLVGPLAELGLLEYDTGEHIRLPALILTHALGCWLFLGPEGVGSPVYFGDDSIALACRLRPKRCGTSLDLCSGPGTLALISARTAARVTAVELNPGAAAIARLNALANKATCVEVLTGDLALCEFAAPFDHVSANPPLLPFPASLGVTFAGDGGEDGVSVIAQILERLPTILAESGIAQILGSGLCSDRDLCFSDRLRDLAATYSLKVDLTVIGRADLQLGTGYFGALRDTVAGLTGLECNQVGSAYADLLSRAGANSLCSYVLTVRHGRPALEVRDLSLDNPHGLWRL